jgi:hypothetical protein
MVKVCLLTFSLTGNTEFVAKYIEKAFAEKCEVIFEISRVDLLPIIKKVSPQKILSSSFSSVYSESYSEFDELNSLKNIIKESEIVGIGTFANFFKSSNGYYFFFFFFFYLIFFFSKDLKNYSQKYSFQQIYLKI